MKWGKTDMNLYELGQNRHQFIRTEVKQTSPDMN